jgi:putative protein-disulfide isomerase
MHHIRQIIYVGDPMCSWCWGFAPEFSKLRRQLEGSVTFSLCMGNLRNGHAWDDAFKHFLKGHWEAVGSATGQPFSMTLLAQESFDYTTEPACRAVCAGRELDQERSFTLFENLQRAFYGEGEDITQREIICRVANQSGYDLETFGKLFDSEAMHQKVASDASRARAYGASAFPSLVIIDGEGHLSVLKGYRTFEALKRMLRL